MRTVYILIGLIVVCAWLGFELRDRYRDVAHLMWGLTLLFLVFLVAGMMGLY